MKITKYVHSCLLVETPELIVLIDPGNYSWDSHLLAIDKLEKLDYIVVTHEHADHYHEPFLRAVAQKFPYTPIVTNNDLADEIKKLEIKNPIMTGSDDNIQVFEAAHEPPSWGLQAPSNIGVHIAGQFTHPGDALHIQHSRDILALPITAPFASIKEALEAAIAIKPKVIIPIHDWPWHKQAKGEYYAKAKKYLQTQGVEFIELENAVPVAI